MRPEGLFFAFFVGEPLIEGTVWQAKLTVFACVQRNEFLSFATSWQATDPSQSYMVQTSLSVFIFLAFIFQYGSIVSEADRVSEY